MTTDAWRERLGGAYDEIYNLKGIFSKCWWVNQEKKEWGALYIFDSEQELNDYLTSDVWTKTVPEKFGCTPEVTILEPALIISKKEISTAEGSWLTP